MNAAYATDAAHSKSSGPTAESGPVTTSLARCEAQVVALAGKLDVLAAVIEPICRPVPDVPDKKGQIESAPASPLHSRLQSLGMMLDIMNNRVAGLTERITL